MEQSQAVSHKETKKESKIRSFRRKTRGHPKIVASSKALDPQPVRFLLQSPSNINDPSSNHARITAR
jgi:hypothetical protein